MRVAALARQIYPWVSGAVIRVRDDEFGSVNRSAGDSALRERSRDERSRKTFAKTRNQILRPRHQFAHEYRVLAYTFALLKNLLQLVPDAAPFRSRTDQGADRGIVLLAQLLKNGRHRTVIPCC